jgi:HPt (histidine-containing phosphotransfer) domain-containing protein
LAFAAVILTTEAWLQQPVLAAGLLLALALLPAFVAGPIRALATARSGAAEAEADRQRMLRLIADAVGPRPGSPSAIAAAPSAASDILELAALEAGRFVPPIETFELRALVTRTLAPFREAAAARGVAVRWRIDPRLPDRVRGRAQAVAHLLARLIGHALDTTQMRAVCLAIEAAGGDARRIRLRLRVDGAGDDGAAGTEGAEASLALRLAHGLAALLDGEFGIERAMGARVRLTASCSLAVEESAAAPMLDLDRRPVLVATEDARLADGLAELLARWNAEPLWVGDADAALAELSVIEATSRAVVIADGRLHLLSALSLAHHAARLGAEAPFVLLVAEEEQTARLADVDEGELDGFVPLPLTDALLANALRALPLAVGPVPSRREATPRPAAPAPPPSRSELSPRSEPPPPAAEERITPIAAHPKFAAETPAAVDPRVIDGLRALGGGPGFLREVIESFRADARQIMERVYQAAEAADSAGFARGLIALHRAAGQLGGADLCELAASLQRITTSELRQHGAAHVRRLDAEIDRLAAALMQYLPASEARR